MTRRRRLAPPAPCADVDGLLSVLRDNLGKADAFITCADELIVRSWGGGDEDEDEDEDGDDSALRRRNHVEYLVESAKLAVRAAEYTGRALEEIASRRRGA